MKVSSLVIAGLFVFLAGCGSASEIVQKAPQPMPDKEVADPDPTRFSSSIEAFLDYDRKNYVPKNEILFVGSSSTRGWKSSEYFPDLKIVNRGFGGSQASDLIHYVDELVLKHEPRIVVLYEGDNDASAGKSANRIFGDIEEFTEILWNQNKEAELLFIAIKPSLARWELWPLMSEVNQMVDTWSETESRVHFVDIGTPMLNAAGRPEASLFVNDGLHMTKAGYDIWSATLRPILYAVDKRQKEK